MTRFYLKYSVKTTLKISSNIFLFCILWFGLFIFPALAQDKVLDVEDLKITKTYDRALNTAAKQKIENSTRDDIKSDSVTNSPVNDNVLPSFFSATKQTVAPKRSLGIADFITSFLFLAIVVISIFVLAWIFKRTGLSPNSGNQVIKIISAIPLSQKEKIALVEVGNQQILIGISPGNIQKLLVLDTPVQVDEASMNTISSPFANQLFKFITKEKNVN
ncbi:MAG: flagellar biosynthetic protein FliO [Pseudomonadota bacterium]